MSAPRYSVVIPTRNRANLLPFAVKSALEQTVGDLEVVVSDNDSSDETPAVCGRLGDPRVRYVRTDRSLPMTESWEFALGHATGELITVLSDDDALVPDLLERMESVFAGSGLELVSWIRAVYTLPDWYEAAKQNSLLLPAVTGRLEVRPSAAMLARWFDSCAYLGEAPMLFNGVCRRSLVESVRAENGRFFIGPAPDIGASIALLASASEYARLDEVLSLAGSGRQSIGANVKFNRGQALQTFVSELAPGAYSRGPFPRVTLTTTVAETLLHAKELMPGRLAAHDVNWLRYFAGCHADLRRYGSNGADVVVERAELWRAALRHGPRAWLGMMSAYLPVTALTGPPPPRRVSGAEAGFSNILECARSVPALRAGAAQRTGRPAARSCDPR